MTDDMISMIFDEARDKMAKAVTHARGEFASVRTGRAAPVLVEKLPVEYYGAEVPLQQLAGFSVPEARTLVISPYDRSSLGAIERAIQQSDLGLSPNNDGTVVRLSFPPLTAERRKELVRVVKAMAEDGRVRVRQARRGARQVLEGLEKEGDISADDLTRAEKELDKVTHSYEGEIDKALEHKERELLEI